jgi:type IV secretory pathway VirJ component
MRPFFHLKRLARRLALIPAVALASAPTAVHPVWASMVKPADAVLQSRTDPPTRTSASERTGLPSNAERISHGLLRDVIVYRPSDVPNSFVIFLAGEEGRTPILIELVQELTLRGALVATVDTTGFVSTLEKVRGDCRYSAGDLDNLSHFVQAYYRLPTYFRPLLAGYSSGASLSYAALAQADDTTFAGALAIAFRPELQMAAPLCPSRALTVRMRPDEAVMDFQPTGASLPPVEIIEGDRDSPAEAERARSFVRQLPTAHVVAVPGEGNSLTMSEAWTSQFLDSFSSLQRIAIAESLPLPPEELTWLPILEVPPKSTQHQHDTFAVLLSGDGGWGSMVKGLARTLADEGIPVVGIDTLRYFWTPRTPESAANDMDQIIRHYRNQWHRQSVMLLDYSQGADVLPFIYNRLPTAAKQRVRLTEVMGVGSKVMFAYRKQEPFSGDGLEGVPVVPELERMASPQLLCIYGSSENDSTCPQLNASRSTVERFNGGHDAGGDTTLISQAILQAAHLN